MISGLLTKIFGSRNDRLLKRYTQTVRAINALEANLQNLTDRFYLSSINNGGSRFVLGAPRSILLSGTVRIY